MVCDSAAFALTTASPVQRAVFRAVEGRDLGELATDPNVLACFGGRLPTPGVKPREVVLLSGVRAAKSLLAAACICRWSQSCSLDLTRKSDTPRANVISVDKDKAGVVLNDHLIGTLQSARLISLLLNRKPEGESVYLTHPSGRPIEAKVVAGKRAGSSLVSRWSVGTVFDEATRMIGDEDGVVNLDDSRAAVLGRLLPGAQAFYIGSPHAPFGPVYNMYSKHFGNPSPNFLIIKAPGPLMNPVYWTEERCEEQRISDPEAYRTDVLGEFLTPEEALFPHLSLDACAEERGDLPPRDDCSYVAAMDPGTRGNAWTFIIAGWRDGKRTVSVAKEWRGSTASPLSPATVLHEIAGLCHRYRVRSVWTDQHSFDALRDIAASSGLNLTLATWTELEKAQKYLAVRAMFVEGEARLPRVPQLLSDLRRVNRKATAAGIRIELPHTGDGRHCDFAPAIALALTSIPEVPTAKSAEDPEVLRMRKAAERLYGRRH